LVKPYADYYVDVLKARRLRPAFAEPYRLLRVRDKFPIINLANIDVEAFDSTVLLWLTKEFFYQRLLLTATGVTEPVGHIICVGE